MKIKFCSWNIKGSNNVVKRKAILNHLKKKNVQVPFLQETHFNEEEHKKYLREWVGQVYFTSYSTNKRDCNYISSQNVAIYCLKILKFT